MTTEEYKPQQTIEGVIRELRRPFTAQALSYKVQATTASRALIVAYIDARQTAERLNLVCPGMWSDSYAVINERAVECHISLDFSGRHLSRADVGISEGDGYGGMKAVYSDAFKRAGVKWGIGASIYYTPKVYVPKASLDQGKYMTPTVEAEARKSYLAWLEQAGLERFGEPLDIGDTLSDQGDFETDPNTEVGEVAKDELRTEIKDAFASYIEQAEDTDKAKKDFQLWLNSEGIPGFDALTESQGKKVLHRLKGDK